MYAYAFKRANPEKECMRTRCFAILTFDEEYKFKHFIGQKVTISNGENISQNTVWLIYIHYIRTIKKRDKVKCNKATKTRLKATILKHK